MLMNSPVNLKELSASEKILLAEALWDDVAQNNPEALGLTETQKKELDRRLDLYNADPEAGQVWDEVKARFKHRQ